MNSPKSRSDTLFFTKMHGIGNDFLVLDCLRNPVAGTLDFPTFALAACDRHFGVGADGLLSLESANDESAIRMRMWNPDGSEDMCGNGLRCVAHLAHERDYVGANFSVQTLSGAREVHVLADKRIRVSMGAPTFEPALVPLRQSEPLIDGTIEIEGHTFRHVTALSTGSTHTIIFSEEPPSDAEFLHWSPRLETAPLFPDRTSVMWAHRLSESRFGVRIWERGAGETLACGTGACAVAVAARITGRAAGTVEVVSKGGTLEIEWDDERGELWKTGPAQIVYEGEWIGG